MEQSTRDILVKARELISDKAHWIQGNYGRNNHGNPVARRELYAATCFCAAGAVIRATQILREDNTLDYAPEAIYKAFFDSPSTWTDSLVVYNDQHSHEEVLALFDRTISDA